MKLTQLSSALVAAAALLCASRPALALERQDANFKIFQFPPDKIPQIDGKADDWAIVPDDYIIGTEQLHGDSGAALGKTPDPKSLDVKIRIGWVKGLNRLYILYEAYDNYWDFSRPGLTNDTFELAVDGDPEARDCTVEFRRGGAVVAVATIGRDVESLRAELAFERGEAPAAIAAR